MSASKERPGVDSATIAIGVLGRPHGVRGEIALRLFNQAGPAPPRLKTVLLRRDGREQSLTITGSRPCPAGLLLTFEGIDSRDQAAALTLSEVRIARGVLPPLAPGEYYVSDLIGCRVVSEDGTELGVITQTFWNGAHDVMIVHRAIEGDAEGEAANQAKAELAGEAQAKGEAEAPEERLIPLVPEFIRQVDTGARVVRVAWDG